MTTVVTKSIYIARLSIILPYYITHVSEGVEALGAAELYNIKIKVLIDCSIRGGDCYIRVF